MEGKEHFIVGYKSTKQISPDDWEVIFVQLLVNKETTIGEIIQWFEEKETEQKWDGKLKRRIDIKPKWFPQIMLLKPDDKTKNQSDEKTKKSIF